MKYLSRLRDVFIQSISNRTYYQGLIQKPFSFSFKYFVGFVLFMAALQVILITIQGIYILPNLPQWRENLIDRLDELYPSELVISVQEGRLSINKQTPYSINIPEVQQVFEVEHAITFDPKATETTYRDYDSFMLVTQDSLVYKDHPNETNDGYTTVPLSDITENGSFGRAQYDALLDQFDNGFGLFIQYTPWLLVAFFVIAPFVIAAFSLVWEMVYLVFLTGILFIVMQAFNLKIPFAKLYQLGLHGLSIPIVLSVVTTMSGWPIPLLFTSSFLLWMVLVLSKFEKK